MIDLTGGGGCVAARHPAPTITFEQGVELCVGAVADRATEVEDLFAGLDQQLDVGVLRQLAQHVRRDRDPVRGEPICVVATEEGLEVGGGDDRGTVPATGDGPSVK